MVPEFNLLDEKWIKVLCKDYTVREVSLTEVLTHAHEYRDLAGELKTQDVAVMRLLLAVLHTVFSRVDTNGNKSPIEEETDALDRWKELWKKGQFPAKPICGYLEKYRDKFYLFHPDYPFYQVSEAKVGTEYEASKLIGELSESNHKARLFPTRTGKAKKSISYSEAARWLLYLNGYDDNALKAKQTGLPAPGAGWLGKLGIVYASGDNLFQTLMLNLTFLRDGHNIWEEDRPVWELPFPHKEERREIFVPNNQAEILTLQSRRVLLKREEEKNKVIGFFLLGGDFFPKENAFAEQMTAWGEIKNGNEFWPKRHDSGRQMWRDFDSLAVRSDNRHPPGVVSWVARLYDEKVLPEETMVSFRIASVKYGNSDYFVQDEFGDFLSFATLLLVDKGKAWQDLICGEIKISEKMGGYLGNLAKNLVKSKGGSEDDQNAQCEHAKEAFYYQLDIPFRRWLVSLNPWENGKSIKIARKEWRDKETSIARKIGKNMAENAGYDAFIGRFVEKSKKHYSAPEALNWFMGEIKKLNGEDR